MRTLVTVWVPFAPLLVECDVRTTFNGDTINVKFATTTELRDAALALTRLLVSLGGKILYGAAPMGAA